MNVKDKQLQWTITFLLAVLGMLLLNFDKILPCLFLALFALLKCFKWNVF